ncbi:hypothetical protein MLPF_1283 [Mycobacterium lepromatosis]|nr:hypothetical protein MLPF_1283 [Mycobacterium lepromatosis]
MCIWANLAGLIYRTEGRKEVAGLPVLLAGGQSGAIALPWSSSSRSWQTVLR